MNSDLTTDDFRAFCKAHDVEFYAMGSPENWDDPTVFRVGTIEWPQRGITVLVSKVDEWKKFQPSHIGEGI